MSGESQATIVSFDPNQDTARLYFQFKRRLARTEARTSIANCDSTLNLLIRKKFSDRQRQFIMYDEQHRWHSHVVARISPTLLDQQGNPLGLLGFFDSFREPQLGSAILQAACQWLRDQGCYSIIGPMDGDTWHSYRLNVGPFAEPAFLSEPTNPEYYASLWQNAGFEVCTGYHSKVVDDVEAVIPVVRADYERAVQNGFTFRKIDLANFDSELKLIHGLSIRAFNHNLFYDEISFDEFKSLYTSARSVVDEDLIWFANDPRGAAIGFLFCIVDYGRAVNAMRGQTGLLAKLRFLWNKRHANAVNFKSICVLPKYRRSGVAAALMHQGYMSAWKKGYRRANLCLIHDDNPSTKLDGGQSRVMRRYQLFQSPGSRVLKP